MRAMRVVFGAGDKVCGIATVGAAPKPPRPPRKKGPQCQIPRTTGAPQTRVRPTPLPAGPQRWPPSSPPAERCLVFAHRQRPEDGRQRQKEGCQKPNGERAGRALSEAAGALVERGRDAGDEQRHRRDRERGQIVEDLAIEERGSARKGVEPKGYRIEGWRDVETVDEGQRNRGEHRQLALAQPEQIGRASCR